ncbi:uncharacterized protein LOC127750761 [Frankliniella occidentalis]|uniref:Uncharacterized protein LOC127750761 n=1 Tax=Frankliniella occidentalis TaxID=133901 RepID=A0A9C6X4Y7_FRAOC|nr:uncharacterized protein LOC127750761 [Frankliniella occidentalis]
MAAVYLERTTHPRDGGHMARRTHCELTYTPAGPQASQSELGQRAQCTPLLSLCPESKWIGVDELQKSHVLLSDKDLLSCHESPETPICAPAVPVHEEEDTCAMALLLSSKKAVTLCEPYLRFIKNPPPTFVSFRSGHTWAFSIQHPTNLMLTDAQGRRLNTNITQLPHTGLLHMPPFSVALVKIERIVGGVRRRRRKKRRKQLMFNMMVNQSSTIGRG